MKEIQLPESIKIDEKENNKAVVTIEPLYPGYGLTLGNALRRVLISSLPGSAITAIKIKGVQHEFSSIEHVKEDIVDIILNIKLIRIKLIKEDDDIVLTLKAKGEKVVTTKDIKTTAGIEIVNPDQIIATLTDKSAELEMELTIGSGLGYSSVESREKEKPEIGVIAIDSIFTPVLKARFEIENVRVGQMTNYDRLTLQIETDSTITPTDAFNKATEMLVNHFSFILNKKNSAKRKAKKGEEEKQDAKKIEKEQKADKPDKKPDEE